MLIEKIREYVRNNSVNKLKNETGVPYTTIISLFKGYMNKKYRSTTLDILYDFFSLEKDDFYQKNKKKWFPLTESLLGSYIRLKRMEKGISLEVLAKKIQMDERTLKRIEAGDCLPNINDWSIKNIIQQLEFDENEIKIIHNYIFIMHELRQKIKDIETKYT